MEKKKSGGDRHWVVTQHDDVRVVTAHEMPSTAVQKGERMKRVYGPYTDKTKAQKQADELEARTLRAQAGR